MKERDLETSYESILYDKLTFQCKHVPIFFSQKYFFVDRNLRQTNFTSVQFGSDVH